MEENKSYFKGILGALIGGLIATIPWILCYVYVNMMFSILAIFIGIASLKGYQLMKGKVDKKLPYIIGGISFISITIATLIIIPSLLLLKENVTPTINNLKILYSDSAFSSAIMKDYIVSILFTFLGTSGVLMQIKKQVAIGKSNIEITNNSIAKDNDNKIRDFFIKYGATNKNNTISEEKLNELEDQNQVDHLITTKVIKKTKDGYYYSLKTKKGLNSIIYILLFIFIFACIIQGIISQKESKEDKTENDKEITFTLPNNYKKYNDEEEENSYYYVPKDDISGESGYILVSHYDMNEEITDYNSLKERIANSFNSQYEIKNSYEFTNDKNNKVIVYEFELDEFYEKIYYVFKNKKFAMIDALEKKNESNKNISEDALNVAKTFDFVG